MMTAYDPLVRRIETAPDQSQISLFIVEKTMIAKTSVISVRLLKVLGRTTALHGTSIVRSNVMLSGARLLRVRSN
jgi:hypothetical protein